MNLNQIWTKKDLDKLIRTFAEETTYLEFKHGGALKRDDRCKNEMAKDISAFANADGGIIIYGLDEKNNVAHALAPFDGTVFTKEWFEQVISSRVRRPIPDIRIDPIRLSKNIKKSIYVIRIPRSPYSPHQTLDKHFYVRRNFSVAEMEEYEIREAFARPHQTVLRICDPSISGNAGMSSGNTLRDYSVRVSISVENAGARIETEYKIEVRIPLQQHKPSVTPDNKFFHLHNRVEGRYHIYSLPCTSALFQSEIIKMASFDIVINRHNIEVVDQLPLLVRLYYSSGIENIEVPLLPHCKHIDHEISLKCFLTDRERELMIT